MSTPRHTATVCKLGGSLLDWSGLPGALSWLEQQWPGQPLVLVVGGGQTADVVRQWDRLFDLGEERAHWLALESLGLNENLALQLWPRLRLARNRAQVEAAHHDGVPALICANCFVRWGERKSFPPLPHTWQVTTDSIAAWVATVLDARELVLAKSVDLPAECSVPEAAARGLVDEYFPQLAGGVPRLSWVNLRTEVPTPLLWRTA